MSEPSSDERTAASTPELQSAREMYNYKYRDEVFTPLTFRPHTHSPSRYDEIAHLLQEERGRVLEIGCGSGALLLALADRFDHLTGIDLSDSRIALGKKARAEQYPQHAGKVDFLLTDGSGKLPFADGSFDVLIASAVLEAVPDIFGLMDEAKRVCRVGGCFVVTVANVCYIKHTFSLLRGRVPLTWSPTREMSYWRKHGWDGGAVRYFSRATLGDLLRDSQFEPEQWSASGAFARYRRWYSNFCGDLCVKARRIN